LKYLILLLAVAMMPAFTYGQFNFQPAELVTDSGTTLTGYIDFQDWSRTPESVQFAVHPDSTVQRFMPVDVQEFTVAGQRYISRNVDIDETPIRVPVVKVTLPKSRKDRVFLRVLATGELSLYQYRGLRSNFYVEENGAITELISHEFVVNQRGKFVFVDQFKDEYLRQLGSLQTDCSHVSMRKLDYNAERLTEFVALCNLQPGEALPASMSVSARSSKGKLKISPVVSAGRYNTGYFITRTTPVEGTDAAGNPTIINLETKSQEEVVLTSIMIGAELIYYLPGDLNTRAVLAGFSIAPQVWGSDEFYPEISLMHFLVGYRYKFRSSGLQPFLQGSFSGFLRSSDYYDEEIAERFIPGLQLGFGIEYGRFWGMIGAELHNRRSADVQQNGISIRMGIQI
jgi:hypothetical protein